MSQDVTQSRLPDPVLRLGSPWPGGRLPGTDWAGARSEDTEAATGAWGRNDFTQEPISHYTMYSGGTMTIHLTLGGMLVGKLNLRDEVILLFIISYNWMGRQIGKTNENVSQRMEVSNVSQMSSHIDLLHSFKYCTRDLLDWTSSYTIQKMSIRFSRCGEEFSLWNCL